MSIISAPPSGSVGGSRIAKDAVSVGALVLLSISTAIPALPALLLGSVWDEGCYCEL